MAKVTFYCNSGANIHSCRKQEVDTVKDLGLDEGELETMREEDREACVMQWAWERLEVYYD
jgi:hypothetical protein